MDTDTTLDLTPPPPKRNLFWCCVPKTAEVSPTKRVPGEQSAADNTTIKQKEEEKQEKKEESQDLDFSELTDLDKEEAPEGSAADPMPPVGNFFEHIWRFIFAYIFMNMTRHKAITDGSKTTTTTATS